MRPAKSSVQQILAHTLSGCLLIALVFALSALTANAQWTTTGNDISNSNTGNVGIGTSTPSEKLNVKGTVRLDGQTQGENRLIFQLSGGDQFELYPYTTGFHLYDRTIARYRFSVLSNGNVGFSTTNPTSRLHIISGTDSATSFLNLDTGTHGGSSFTVGGNTNNESTLDLSVYRVGAYVSRFGVSNLGNVYLQPAGGNVGVGTTAPAQAFEVKTTGGTRTRITLGVGFSGGLELYTTAGTFKGGVLYDSPSNVTSFYGPDSGASALNITSNGNIGIGTLAPTKKLNVAGDVDATGTITGANIVAKYQDVAEWVDSSQQIAAGTVVVLDTAKPNQVTRSVKAYDSRVAGVVSLRPGLTLGDAGSGRVLVATTGRVKVKVEAKGGPIQIGDLLVTSDREGYAMKSVPVELGGVRLHRPGTLIGKALEPLAQGEGEILVLLSLQ